VVSTGHCHPRVVAAIQKQAARLVHMSGTDFYYENMVTLAERLAATLPGPRKVYFGNSGAEAVESAMKLARYATHRSRFIAFLGAFHGRTLGALSLTASKAVQRRGFGPLIPGVHHVPYPDTYRHGDAAARLSLEAIDRLFHTIAPPEEVAAIFVEPVQGEGGYLVPPKGFLEDLARIAKEHGILLVFDEVQCGMGRTGKLWAWQHSGVAPDILTTAKGIASGLPLSAMIARADLMQWKPGAQASTFGGNPVAIAAALETMDLLEESLIDNAARVGAYMMERLANWPQRIPCVGDVRGVGLMLAIELVRDRQTKERAPDLRDAVVERAFERGLLVLGAGENAIRLCPPLVITRDQADFALDVLEEACKSVQA
jgi:4-aminobutyrate aminotransferase